MNTVFTIRPYKLGNVWVFDDEQFKLRAEPFVGMINVFIDYVIEKKNLKNAHKGFTLSFSENFLPNADIKLIWVRPDVSGNWYRWDEANLEGWLCDCLYNWYKEPPKELYAVFEK